MEIWIVSLLAVSVTLVIGALTIRQRDLQSLEERRARDYSELARRLSVCEDQKRQFQDEIRVLRQDKLDLLERIVSIERRTKRLENGG